MCKLQLCADSRISPRLLAKHWRQTTLERSIDNAMIVWQYSGDVVQLSAPRDELVYESNEDQANIMTWSCDLMMYGKLSSLSFHFML